MTKRKLWILLSLFLLVLAACGNLDNSGEDFAAPEEPNIRLINNDAASDGTVLVSCWTRGEDNVVCDVTDSVQPGDSLAVGAGDQLRVEFEGEVGDPDNISISVKSVDENGQTITHTTLQPSVGASFVLDALPEDNYHLEITGYYGDIAGSAATYSEVFAITLGDGTAVAGIPTATEDISLDATDVVETEVVETDEPDDATMTVTPEITLDDTMLDTATVEAQETADAGATALVDDTDVATATTLPTDTQEPTSTPTVVPTDTPIPTDTLTATPTATSTNTPTPAFTQVEGLPTFAPPLTPTLLPPGDTGAPQVSLRSQGVDYLPRATTFCEVAADGSSETCNDETVQVDLIQGVPGGAINFIINAPRPQRMTYSLLSSQVFTEVASGERSNSSNTYLFNLIEEPGVYILEVEIFYEDAYATYVYQVVVQ